MANLMMLLSNTEDGEIVEVSQKGVMPLSSAVNYLLVGHHVCNTKGMQVYLAKKDDESFFLQHDYGEALIIDHTIQDPFQQLANALPDGAFVEQLKELDSVYKATNFTLSLDSKIYDCHNAQPTSQQRSEEALDRGESASCIY